MLGAIIGDIIGSIYEVEEITALKNKTKVSYEGRIKVLDENTPLFRKGITYTDDTCLTVAIMDALLNNEDYEKYLKDYGLKEYKKGLDLYGRSRFGSGFVDWLKGNGRTNSYGNGCAMRISAIPFLLDDMGKIRDEVYKATIPTHNCEESINCSLAVADAIYMAKNKFSKEEIKKYIEDNYFSLDYDLEDLQRNYKFTMKSYDSVPLSIYAFLIANDFEDGIRKAISMGGDTDTIASIAGAILEAYYGIPKNIKEEAIKYIPEDYMKVINKLYLSKEFIDELKSNNMYDKNFFKFLKGKIKIIPSGSDKAWFGCFPLVDKNNIIIDMRMIVPELLTEEDLLINIHEYTHAFEIYSELDKVYDEKRNERENSAITNEKKYLLKKFNKVIKGKVINNEANSR